MVTRTVGIREFRDNLSAYLLESETPVAITRHGETVGHYYPARRRPTGEQLRELRESGERLQAELDAKGLTEEELIKDFEELRAKSPTGLTLRQLVLDANILIRAALGRRVLTLLAEYGSALVFLAHDTALDEAGKHLSALSAKRGLKLELLTEAFQAVGYVVERIPAVDYSAFEETALRRIASRDPDDWPVVATALLLQAPVWTEDRNFFGTGVAGWATNNGEVYLRGED